MDRNIFELATRQSLRYPSPKGELTTEQLWDLSLTHRSGFDLDNVARGIARYLKDLGEESFVEAKPSLAKAKAELALEVVKHIISVKQAEKAAAEAKLETEARRKKIQEALASKQDAALANMSEEDLKAELASLNAQ